MAQSGYTPIQLYYSTTAAAVPVNTNLASGELALNIQDEKLYFKNAAGTVKLLASNATSAPVTSFQTSLSGLTPSTSTTGAVTLAGTLGTSSGGTNLTSFTSGGAVYATSTSALTTGTLPIASGGTGQTTANAAFNALVPSQTGNSGKYLTTDGSNTSWGTNPLGTVTSVAASVPSFLSISGSPITTSGTLAISLSGTALPTTSGGTGLTSFTSGGVVYASSTSALATGSNLYFDATNLGVGTNNPQRRLHVKGGGALTQFESTTSSCSLYIGDSTSSVVDNQGIAVTGNNLFLFTSGVEKVRITSAGNVGIGTSSPTTKLEVNGNVLKIYDQSTGNANLVVRNSTTGDATGFTLQQDGVNTLLYNSSNGYMAFATNATERARISAAGGFSVGTTADPGAGAIYATGNITAYYSDARLKTVSGKIENALDKVAQLSGVYYTNNSVAKSFGYDSDEVQVGVLAQDVEAVLPQIVKAAPFDLDENNNSKSGENYKTVQYERLVPLLIEAINELQAKVKALESK